LGRNIPLKADVVSQEMCGQQKQAIKRQHDPEINF
jgi:hypothetical protein